MRAWRMYDNGTAITAFLGLLLAILHLEIDIYLGMLKPQHLDYHVEAMQTHRYQ